MGRATAVNNVVFGIADNRGCSHVLGEGSGFFSGGPTGRGGAVVDEVQLFVKMDLALCLFHRENP